MRIAPRGLASPSPQDTSSFLRLVGTSRPDEASAATDAGDATALPNAANVRSDAAVLTGRRPASNGTIRLWRVDVPGVTDAVPLLRRWVRLLLADDGKLTEAFELIVSEYGTNALWHSASGGPGGRIGAELCISRRQTRLTVLDDGPVPARTDEEVDPAEHGRGLILADAYADETGQYDCADGHAAWALINR